MVASFQLVYHEILICIKFIESRITELIAQEYIFFLNLECFLVLVLSIIIIAFHEKLFVSATIVNLIDKFCYDDMTIFTIFPKSYELFTINFIQSVYTMAYFCKNFCVIT